MLDINDVRQTDQYSCGAAAVVSVLRFWKHRVGYDSCAQALLTDPHHGTHPQAIEHYLRRVRGMKVVAGEMDLETLRWLTRRWPVILVTRGHYIVCCGFYRGRVGIQCPESGFQTIPIADLESIWQDMDSYGADYDQYGIAAYVPD